MTDAETSREHRQPRMASMLGAGVGGLLLLMVALPIAFMTTLPLVLDPEVPARDHPTALTLIAVCAPIAAAGAIALRQRANVRVTVLLVAVPEAVICVPLLLLCLLGRP
ncbi:hypothetical protein CLV92_102137 [Kineococcus xinjiangensis]|uniref:Uncharacterized protein n=1 Tax=Kineococcus xinjiangensis TaxID=512762 RepID=A0A2S6IUS5_9ACTN|nr:hypothetical protein [Kineococcus xinjiangensis]PPK97986.1 hypothetical protein CLV92_102137 [Kineococcus xinjiangensis]